jgi:hypothetical protein
VGHFILAELTCPVTITLWLDCIDEYIWHIFVDAGIDDGRRHLYYSPAVPQPRPTPPTTASSAVLPSNSRGGGGHGGERFGLISGNLGMTNNHNRDGIRPF